MTQHTVSLQAGQKSPLATIADAGWLVGHWKGEGWGGVMDEVWSPPSGGAMMGMYRLVRDGRPVFYELMTIVEENQSLVLRLKHFNPNLAGWEEKEKTIDFPLAAKADGALHFEGLTYRADAQTAVTVFLAINAKDEGLREEELRYERSSTRD